MLKQIQKKIFILSSFFLLFLGISTLENSQTEVKADGAAVIAQLVGYVQPTNSFNVGNLSVGNEASLELGTGSKQDVIWRVIRVMATLAGTAAILSFIIGGMFLVTSQNDEGITKGKDIIKLTTIGVVVIFAAYMIVQFTLALIFAV